MQRTYRANLPQKRYTAAQIRLNESIVAADLGIEMFQLMEDAGKAMFEMVADHFDSISYRNSNQQTPMTVLCGYGNNGGDGYIVARLAKAAGWQVTLVQIGDERKISGDALKARQQWLNSGGKVEETTANELILPQGSIIIDALLGTGLGGEVRSPFAEVINLVNQTNHAAVCSVDVPSGLNADTGQPMGCAIKADMTCTFVGVKQGLLTGYAGDYCGQLYFSGLGISEAFEQSVLPSAMSVTADQLHHKLPPRALSSHKGQCGHVLLIGGNKGMSGAIRMAAMACLRAGAGLVTVLTHADNVMIVAIDSPEIMVSGVEVDNGVGDDISPWLQKADVVVFGPGAGQDEWAQSLLQQVRQANMPKVIDADGLNLAALQPGPLNRCIITPHPKEAARLLNWSVAQVQEDRFFSVGLLAKTYDCVALLKGYGTLVCEKVSDGESIAINTTGNPGMATAGMGDVLSGILGGLLAQGLSLMDAATLGAMLHGAAADSAANKGQRGMMATDLYPHIRALVNR